VTALLALLLALLKANAVPFLIAFGTAFVRDYLKRKGIADSGAAQQRAADQQATDDRIREARERHAESGDASDDDLRARARRDWLQPQ
jgi:hypothetical protein